MSQIVARNNNAFNDVPVVKNIGGRNVEAFTNTSVPQRRVFVQVSPSTAISSNILQGSQLEFRLENPVDRIGTCYLRIDWANSSGANFVHSGPTDMWLQQIQIYANNGSVLLYQTNDPVATFLINSVLQSRNEYENSAALRGSDANYSTGTITNGTGTSGSYYISLAPNFWRSLHLRPYTFDGNLIVRIKFQDAANIISSGTWTTTACYLEFTGYMESEEQKKQMIQRAEKPKILSYYAPQVHMETLTLAASTQYQVRLSGINGYTNQIFFVLRSVAYATSPANQFDFERPLNFDILDPQAKSLTGFKNQSTPDMLILYSHLYDNKFLLNTNACVYTFSQSPGGDVAMGSFHGGVDMRGYHILQFNTQSTIVPGSFQVLVYAMCNESLIIENAQLKTTRH